MNETAPKPRRCYTCKRVYIKHDLNVACAVMHGPGSCCHYMEQEVTGREAGKVQAEPSGWDAIMWKGPR